MHSHRLSKISSCRGATEGQDARQDRRGRQVQGAAELLHVAESAARRVLHRAAGSGRCVLRPGLRLSGRAAGDGAGRRQQRALLRSDDRRRRAEARRDPGPGRVPGRAGGGGRRHVALRPDPRGRGARHGRARVPGRHPREHRRRAGQNAGTRDGSILDFCTAIYYLNPDGTFGEYRPMAQTTAPFDLPAGRSSRAAGCAWSGGRRARSSATSSSA